MNESPLLVKTSHIPVRTSHWDLNLYQSVLPSIHACVMKEKFVILHIKFKFQIGVHFRQNATKNNDLLKKYFEQKLFWIQFSTKNSVDACLYLTLELS